jgi:predicted PurR-regulated permease PerM
LTTALKNLVANLEKLSNQEVVLGPFNFFVPELTATYLSNLLVEQVQPILGQAGSLVGKALSGGANLIFRLFMMYLISYFFTSETDSVKGQKISFNLPGYENDVQQMGKEINNIWNAFIRGEFLVVGTAIFIYSILLSGLQMPYSLGLALIAGLGRFIPYVGAWVSWLTFAIVALITRPTPFGALPLVYTAIVVGVTLVVDNILDNVMTPKVMGNALKVHPAAVLISALIGSQLIGIIGIILAAPVFATVKLVTHYVFHKLTDQDPWEGISYSSQRKELALTRFFRYLKKKLPLWSKQARVKVAEGWRKVFKQGAGSSGGPVQHP